MGVAHNNVINFIINYRSFGSKVDTLTGNSTWLKIGDFILV